VLDNPSIIQQTIAFLNYNGPLIENLNEIKRKDNQLITHNTIASVEVRSGCISEKYLFYYYLKQGFLVNHSPAFKQSYFRVRYFNYDDAKYWP